MFAYSNLPEWAQPITWGLAAATPISIIIIACHCGFRWADLVRAPRGGLDHRHDAGLQGLG